MSLFGLLVLMGSWNFSGTPPPLPSLEQAHMVDGRMSLWLAGAEGALETSQGDATTGLHEQSSRMVDGRMSLFGLLDC
jgi:hypothetical protein